MKKYLSLSFLALILCGCDDGDLTFDSFDFSQVQAKRCSNNSDILNSIFKINENEALILQFPQNEFPFLNKSKDTTFLLNANRKLTYRVFDENVSDGYFCSLLPPITPKVIDEWTSGANAQGQYRVVTRPVEGTSTLETAKYEHAITLNNIAMSSSTQSGSIIYETLNFGVFQTNTDVTFNFNNANIFRCSDAKIFKILDKNPGNVVNSPNINCVLEVTIPDSLLPEAGNTEAQPIFIDNNLVKVTYKVFYGDVFPANYCASANLPTLFEQWNGDNGIDQVNDIDDQGYISVTRSEATGQVSFNLVLRNVTYRRVTPVASSTEFQSTFVRQNDTFGIYIP
ncbi:hypothetical protein GV828_03405 [Flavobacterium sp. NST-5]|uniref:Lipoprotein n=1 Tax=Flavobacterium ichthyis TaxID=2698827 RepID=A0ABW9ZAZ1_9FLAO|nr:hypothetical protein [Flavobacterium ichthyis]NBL64245.1 hypothetical protein [Flavobacterium ichthyis]